MAKQRVKMQQRSANIQQQTPLCHPLSGPPERKSTGDGLHLKASIQPNVTTDRCTCSLQTPPGRRGDGYIRCSRLHSRTMSLSLSFDLNPSTFIQIKRIINKNNLLIFVIYLIIFVIIQRRGYLPLLL